MPRTSSIREFILDILVQQNKEIAEMENGKYTYQAFALEAISIELLGKVLSGKDLFEYVPRQPQIDFEKAIEFLFPKDYHEHKTILYKQFRCSMLHTFAPHRKITLGGKEIVGRSKKDHLSLTPKEGKLVLLFEEFHKDFTSAVHKLLDSDDEQIQKKLNKTFLNIGPVESI